MLNPFVDLRKYLVLAVLVVIQQGAADLRADNGPYIHLHGKVNLPAGVDRLELICELVEEKPNRPFRYEVTPIKIKDDLTFVTRTTGRSYRTALIVRSADKKWAALWYCHQYELLSNSAKQLELKLVPAERRAVQVTYEAQPQAGATVFVYDEFNAEPMTTDKDGIVWIRPSWDGRKVFLAATNQDKLVAQPQEVKLPVDGSPLQLVLQKCDRAPVQVVGTDGKPVADVAISSCFLGDESRSKEPTFASFYARSDQDGVTTPLFYSEEYEILSPNMRFVSFETSSTPHRVVVAPVQPKVEVRGKIEIPSGIGEGLLLRGTSNQNNFRNQFSIFVCRVNRDGTFVAEVHPEYTYDVLVSDATWVSSTWTGVMASSKPDLATSVSLDIVEGEQVEVLVTRGKDFAPASGVWVYFLQLQGGRRWAARTDDEGVIATRARQGELKMYASQDDWEENLKATVRSGETTVLTFHRNEFEPVAFTGQVSISEADASNLALSDISIDLHFVENLPVVPIVVGDDGRFQAIARKPHIALAAQTKDRKYRGAQAFDLESKIGEVLTLELRPSISIFGRILDPDGFPLSEAQIGLETRPKATWRAKDRWDSSVTDYVTATTDNQGRYSFAGVCSGVSHEMFASFRDRQNYATTIFKHHVLEPSDALLPTVIMPESDMNSRSLQTRLHNRINSSKLLNTNVIFVYYGSDKSAIEMASGLFASDESKAAGNLSPLLFSDAELQVYPSNATWIKEQGLELSNDQELMLVLFDQTGNAIFRKRVQETAIVNSISEIIGSEQLQLVEQKWDAKARFDMSLELAHRTDRDIWASFVSIRNPASIALLRWQEENRKELEKHFVLLQIDWLRDEDADAMADRFGVVKNYENRLDCVLINKEGRQLQEQQMQSTQFIDRVRIGSLLNATNKPIDPSKTKAWLDSM